MNTKCLIIGSGPAGYTAATYAARANLNPVLYEGMQPGGQLTTTSEVENFPGFPEGVEGGELMDKMREQALRFGTDIRPGFITAVNLKERPFMVQAEGEEPVYADTVIIATGAQARYLGLEDEQRFMGRGVSACATCDGFFYRGRRVAVVGGGDTACEEALYLSHLAREVYLIVRRGVLRASRVMQQRVFDADNINVLFYTQTEGLYGDEVLEGAHLVEHRGEPGERHFDLPVDGFFLAIGHDPMTVLFKDIIDLDDQGYIITYGKTQATNIPGVFAAGDVADPRYQQACTAAASGCRAALDAEAFLLENH